jgi:hypothetical protein
MEVEKSSQNIVYDIIIDGDRSRYTSAIEDAIECAKSEIETLYETTKSLDGLKPECDKLDYALAVGSGALCGIIDIFLVGKPGESPLGDITDKWFENRTKDFAKMCGWKDGEGKDASSAIRYLEKKFKIPYDQRGAGDIGSKIFGLSPENHHFKSLGHNPSLLGLFFSILDQFNNESHFVSNGMMISLQQADDKFELRGHNLPSKLFCAFANWFGHLISDVSGSSGSKGRGMGIPSPLWTWGNDIIAIKSKLKIPVSEFNQSFNELALKLYENGYDTRFQTAQLIPVFINEMLVRLLYSVRRLLKYFKETNKEERSFILFWKQCEPFKNPTIKRMLTVAHCTFLVIDAGDAVIRSFIAGGGCFNPVEFFLRLNVVGVGRVTISLYGEVKRGFHIYNVERNVRLAEREIIIVENYIEGLNCLAEMYNDHSLVNLVADLKEGRFSLAFEKSINLAEKREVPKDSMVRSKSEIDAYFMGGRNK